MTTQHPSIRRLHRRSDDRVLAGVASGLGDYFNVDPLLIRILLVASLVFGGLGIFLYVAAWLLVPDDQSDQSVAERTLGGMSLPGGLLGGILAVIGALILLSIVVGIGAEGGGGGLFLAIIVVAAGAILLRRNQSADVVSGATAADVSTATPPSGEATTPYVAAPRVRRPPSPLGWYVVGAALVGIGLLAIADSMGILFPQAEHYFGLVILTLGAGLVVGAWWGRAPLLIVLGLLLLPFAWAAGLVDVPLEGGWGRQSFSPTTADELEEEYRLAGGSLMLDLSDYSTTDAPIELEASIGFGELRILLPEDAAAEIDAAVGGGLIGIGDRPRLEGTHLEDHATMRGEGPTFHLELDAGIGAIRVDRIPSEDR